MLKAAGKLCGKAAGSYDRWESSSAGEVLVKSLQVWIHLKVDNSHTEMDSKVNAKLDNTQRK